MFDHVGVAVTDLAASERFYRTVLSVLGSEPTYADAEMVGWQDWWIGLRIGADEPGRVQMVGKQLRLSLMSDRRPPTEHVHLAFSAHDDATVKAFHAAAIAAGYEDHGRPGERAIYHPGYYGAFILDPDGHNVEVVNHNR